MQGWRVVGSGFLFVHGYGFLPGVFAYQAGWGDVLVGLPCAAGRGSARARRFFHDVARLLELSHCSALQISSWHR